ncbi:MAG: Hpt domain-containing protein [Flavobacteriales bacterium]|nr:Hpt domain-containing protein [Flavobacteriales bacterium]
MARLYDLKQLEELSGGSKDFIIEIIYVFISEVPLQVENIKNAFTLGNMDDLASNAHKQKPSIDLLGIITITQDIRSIETIARNRENISNLKGSINNVDVTLNNTIIELKSDFNL